MTTPELISTVLVCIYTTALIIVTTYCFMQFHLLYYYLRKRRSLNKPPQPTDLSGELPFVTIQLPIYNEYYVVERLLDCVTKMDYPKDRFEIHLLDDSTDETVQKAAKAIAGYKQQGYNIEHVTRIDRKGYKAGALKDATPQSRGDLIAIFDADFLPQPSFLRDTIAYFENPEVGVVQTRWGHINRDYSLLTQVQALQLNVHFTVEQLGRQAGDLFLQFNGTAGVWRKECISDAGGWEADTLTEDLDLSYRAQLRDWKIVFLENQVSPAELPAEMNGLKSQQYRWMKGGAETAKKMLPSIWRSDICLKEKIHASVHLLSSSVFLAVFIVGIFSVPLAFFNPLGYDPGRYMIFLASLMAIGVVYYIANVHVAWREENKLKTTLKFILLFPIFLSLSMGLSLHNSIAVLQGYLGKQTAFIRTPKFDIKAIGDKLSSKIYFDTKISKVTIFEGLLMLYFSYSIYYGIKTGTTQFLPLHAMLTLGYGLIFYYSIKNRVVK